MTLLSSRLPMWIVNKMTDRKSSLAFVFIASLLVSGMAAGAVAGHMAGAWKKGNFDDE